MSKPTTQACENCRLRKVRCDRDQPCSQCAHLKLSCVFAPAPGKRKPPVRGRLVAQARENARKKGTGVGPGNGAEAPETLPTPAGPATPDSGPGHAEDGRSDTASQYTPEFFSGLMPQYETLVYPVNPIVSPDEIHAAIANMHSSPEDAALVYAFATVTTFLAKDLIALNGGAVEQMNDLMCLSLAAHRSLELSGEEGGQMLEDLPVTVKRIVTCIFLEVSMMAFKRFGRSFVLLREAITLLQILKVDLYVPGQTAIEKYGVARCQRLYWEAYIHERFLTIAAGYPSVLPPLKTGLPRADADIPAHIDLGFNRLIHLFLILDEPFLTHWQAQQGAARPTSEMTARWIELKQAQLDQDELSAAAAVASSVASGQSGLTGLQHTDIYITRLWLRTLVWQLALSHGLLRSTPPKNTHEGLSLHFPAQRLSSQLRTLVGCLDSVASIGAQGTGILQKLFEITSTIGDVMALPTGLGQMQDGASVRMDDFVFLTQFLLSFDRIRPEQREYLKDKLETLQLLHGSNGFRTLV